MVTARAGAELAAELPVARVAVDSGLLHLDRPFDYAVPAAMAQDAQFGCRVRVRFAGRLVDGLILGRAADSAHDKLAPLASLVSAEPVLSPEIAALARAVADRSAGALYDVLRLAVPPRHARVEAQSRPPQPDLPPAPDPAPWARYTGGPSFLAALQAGGARPPRAVWTALPGPDWPAEIAVATQACAATGRGVVVVVPDGRDLQRVSAALGDVPHAALAAELGPAERYRRWLAVRRGDLRVVVGTRAAMWAPVADLGLAVLWDDGDDLHAEPRAPYVHAREVLALRAHLSGAALLLGGHARTAEGQLLLDTGWARPLQAPRATVRTQAPRVEGVSDEDLARDPLARAARLPAKAFEAARQALAEDQPVLVQVPRRGHAPSLACARDRRPARCATCQGPLGSDRDSTSCAWCGRPATDWRCPICGGQALRAVVVGARRTAQELGRAFPGVPVRTSGRDEVLTTVSDAPQLVVATPGAEPVADGAGYGAVLLLDAWAMLGRADLRAGEETLRRWFAAAALARPAGRVVVAADSALVPVQALVRWDPAGAAARELADRAEVGFPPAARLASLSGSAPALREFLAALSLPEGAEVLGPVAAGDGERALVRIPREQGAKLVAALRGVSAVRSAAKREHVRVEVDPQVLS